MLDHALIERLNRRYVCPPDDPGAENQRVLNLLPEIEAAQELNEQKRPE